MAHTNSPRTHRTYWGHDKADLLILWLNQTDGTARNQRVVALLDLINAYIRATDSVPAPRPSSPRKESNDSLLWYGKKMPKGKLLAMRNVEIEKAARAVNVALHQYVQRPELVGRYADRPLFAWRVPLKEDWMTSEDRICIQSNPPKVSVLFTEGDAVRRIIELCHEGLVERVQLCVCKTWFYAKFSHMKFHKTACQQKAYRDDPVWKAHRREYVKGLRAMHKKKIFRSER